LCNAAVEGAVVLIVTVEVTGLLPEIAAGCVAEQVGGSTAPVGLEVTAHASDTLPVNPPVGVTVMVEVAFVPGDPIITGVLLSVKLGGVVGTFTVNATVVVCTVLPAVPVTVAV
jgi:hypothetical protein